MRGVWVLLIAVLCMSLPHTSSLLDNAEAVDVTYEAGFVEWNVNNLHRIYISGDAEEINLTRDYQGKSEGHVQIGGAGTIFNPLPTSATVGPLSMPPLEMGFNGTFNISTFVSAHLVSGNPQACRSQFPLTIETTVEIGNITLIGSAEAFIGDATVLDPANLSTPISMMDIEAREGAIISFTMVASTNCPSPVSVNWGGQNINSGGITISGDMFSPDVSVTVDDAKIAHIQFVGTLPWGFDDLDNDFTTMEIYGPLEPDQKRSWDEDERPEVFTATSTYIIRSDEMGRDAKVFTGRETLPVGDNVLVMCLKTIDSQNFKEDCDHEGFVRFNVEDTDEPIASAYLWMSISGFVAVIAYLGMMLRQGILLPLPLIGALVVMALLMIPLAGDIPDMGGEAVVEKDARAPSFVLHQNSNSSMSLNELLDGKEAVVLGISLPASTNAEDQARQLENVLDRLGDRVSVAQVITGEDVRMDDIITMQEQTNASWPIMTDDGESRFANRMPHGVSDSVVVIDKSGHITFSSTGTASSEDIIDAVEGISSGGLQSPMDLFSLLWGPGLAMLLVALPRKRYEPAEQPLPPGSLWASITLAGGVGFLMVNLVPLILTFIPSDNDFRLWFDLGLIVWFISAAVRAAIVGTPWEVRFISSQMYKLYSENFQSWRENNDVERDLLIGFWMGWFIWLAFPAILAQGVGALTLTGGFSWLFGPFMLLVYCLTAGVLTLLIRLIATWGGPLSTGFGSFGSGPFAEALGWALIPISLWVMADTVLDVMSIGLF